MSEKDNPHKDHRERLRKRFMENDGAVEDHELLELLLFYSVPRKNTNIIAHDLLSRFNSVSGVVHAPVEALKAVDGIGDNSACLLSLIGKISDRIRDNPEDDEKITCPEDARTLLAKAIGKEKKEIAYIYYLNQRGKVIKKDVFTQYSPDYVSFNYLNVQRECCLIQPKSIIIAHNHPNGLLLPSADDDKTTERLALFCKVFDIEFADHIIVSGEQIYSYRDSGRLESIFKKIGEVNI